MKYIKLFEHYDNELYHVSFSNLDRKILVPRIPQNYMTDNNFEDNFTERVSFSSSIEGCLIALNQNLEDKYLYVHIPNNISSLRLHKPSIKEVPDSDITNEIWSLSEVELKCIGKILITSYDKDPIIYYYGDGIPGQLYKWYYKWI